MFRKRKVLLSRRQRNRIFQKQFNASLGLNNDLGESFNVTENEIIELPTSGEGSSTDNVFSLEPNEPPHETQSDSDPSTVCLTDTAPEIRDTGSEIESHESENGDKTAEHGLVDKHESEDEMEEHEIIEESNKLLQLELASWSTTHNITQQATNALLSMLKRNGHDFLPNDSRTLLKTPRHTNLKEVKPGQYLHLGLKKNLLIFYNSLPAHKPATLQILINIDGIPLTKSSSSQFWPILGKVLNYNDCTPFIIGVYHGTHKPEDCNAFLADFVKEAIELSLGGLSTGTSNIPFKVCGLICDAPARSFVTGIKGHGGYFGCGKCTQEGEYLNGRMCFPEINCVLRSDQSFSNKTQEEHHLKHSILETIPGFGMVSQVPFEYMHLVCLGVMRKLLNLWMRSKDHAIRLQSRKIEEVSKRLISLKQVTCSEFARKPRALKEMDRWKATEFRSFLLYTGPLVMKNILSEKFYDHFLCLHVAVRILVSPSFCRKLNSYAKSLLKHFVSVYEILYGRELISYNVHGLLHLADDVLLYGHLDIYSTFDFENHLGYMKKLMRKSDRSLQQLNNRLSEKESCLAPLASKTFKSAIDLKGKHFDGPLAPHCKNPQYRSVMIKGFLCASKLGDSCFILKDGAVVIVENIATLDSQIVVIGRKHLHMRNAFTVPCLSSTVDIFLVTDTLSRTMSWPLSSFKVKAIRLPCSNNFLVLSLLHK